MKRISLLLLFICLILITGCSTKIVKDVKSLDDFMHACNDNGYMTSDNMSKYQDINYITGSIVATLDNMEIEMVTYDKEDNAINAQESQIELINSTKGSGAVTTNEKGKNYQKYEMITNGFYTVSTRVENTLIFSRVPVDNRESLDNVLEAIGY